MCHRHDDGIHSSAPESEQMAGVRNQLAKRQPLAKDVRPSTRNPPSTRRAFIGLLELAATIACGSSPHSSSTSAFGQVAADSRAAFATIRNQPAQLSSRATACTTRALDTGSSSTAQRSRKEQVDEFGALQCFDDRQRERTESLPLRPGEQRSAARSSRVVPAVLRRRSTIAA